MTDVLICCGVGGAGKTTSSATLALSLALAGQRVVVLTIDPARRLADALGLAQLGNTPQRIQLPSGTSGSGTLDALMLDRKATWDAAIRRQAPDEEAAERVLANRYYCALSERLTGGHEYMATEMLYQLVESGKWDVVVVDTPPTQHALDFFAAPDRIRRILDQRLIGALLRPSTGLLGAATRRVSALIQRLAGAAVIQDLAEFFQLVAGLSEGFRDRGQAVHELLRSERCKYYLILHADAPRLDDVLMFISRLREEGMLFSGSILNRTATPVVPSPETLRRHQPAAPETVDPIEWGAAIETLLRYAERQQHRSERHASLAQTITQETGAPAWRLPDLGRGIESVDTLALLASHLPVEGRRLSTSA